MNRKPFFPRGSAWAFFKRAHPFRPIAIFAALLCTLAFSRASAAEVIDETDLSTPRRAAANFVDAADRGDWNQARTVLEGGTTANQAKQGRATDLSQKLAYLLSRSVSFDLDKLSDAPEGTPEDGADTEKVATLRVDGDLVPLVLRKLGAEHPRWVFSAGTLTRVPELYAAHGPSPIEAHLPPALRKRAFGMAHWQWLGLVLGIAFAILVGRVLAYLSSMIGARLAARTRMRWDDELVVALRSPTRLFASVIIFVPLVALMRLPGPVQLVCWRVASTLFLVALAWSAIRIVGVVANLVERRAHGSEDASAAPMLSRGVQTQVRVLRRVASLVIAVCAGAIMLMQFEVVRSVGVSLLASAGVAGIVLGLAAQRTLGSLFAGIQLSITQPIRIGDSVIVENEYGVIEEITLTYVVVKIWDERRMIVPMARFLEHPFQNWTKVSSQLHGTVMLYADWSLPVDALRAELDRLLENNPAWDGRTKVVHVTDAKERTLEIRVLVSAADPGTLFGLRAGLRERLVTWLSELDGGRHLPRARVEGSEPIAARATQ